MPQFLHQGPEPVPVDGHDDHAEDGLVHPGQIITCDVNPDVDVFVDVRPPTAEPAADPVDESDSDAVEPAPKTPKKKVSE